MSAKPSVFISFSQLDQSKVRELFAGLGVQRVDVWDYSDAGQELEPGEHLKPALKAKIDSCDYFLAVISANSIKPELAPTPIFEVRYAIDSGKARDRVVPILLDDPPREWPVLYKELADLVWLPISTHSDEELEDAIRRVCQRLKIEYIPPHLLNPAVFFAGPFLREIRSKRLQHAAFVQLRRYMNSAGEKLLSQEENDKLWTAIKEEVISFMGGAKQLAPQERFFYPRIVRGVAELQLREFANAEQTFLAVTSDNGIDDEWLGLAFAGLGHTHFAMERFDDSGTAFGRAAELLPDDKHVRVNYLAALAYSGGQVLDDPASDLLEDPTLSTEDRVRLITLQGVIKYKQGDYSGAIEAFESLDPDELNETSAIYYEMVLREYGMDQHGIEVLENTATRIKSHNLYHHLAHAYLRTGNTSAALKVYETALLHINEPAEFARQLLVEYAQLIKSVEGSGSKKFRDACERAVNFTLLPKPQSKPDWFFTGFAFYLLGKEELARFHHQCSDGFATDYYDQLELTT